VLVVRQQQHSTLPGRIGPSGKQRMGLGLEEEVAVT